MTSPTETDVDLLIIGAGPAGLYGAYYAGFRGFSVAIMDSLIEPGGQVAAMYPEKDIFDVAGFPVIKGQHLVDNLVEQAGQFHPTYLLGHRAEEMDLFDDRVEVTSHKGATVTCKAVVITGGIGTFTPRPLPDADDWEGRGLQYFVPKLDVMADKDVLIVGGGDSAFDWALNLRGIARSLTIVHRRDRFRAHETTVKEVMASDVEVLTFHEVARINGAEHIESVEVFDNRTDERRTIPCQAVVAALGFTADLGPLKKWGLEQDKRQIVVDTAMQTNLHRVFAAGDITTYDGKVKLISVGFGEAATAVNNAVPLIDPDQGVFPGHSSDRK
ncbi:NAD(P)/FAD-dependent oxidoreductase [Euzebya sp.]|uniref:NAD(P)/FAD-dependent oxidoreductase n=1 Tax=Euzebya sp. TaxID=1971409 RepID=UPI003519549A